jgi:CRP/FNR family transcriptional regulator, cyclic AMP receptor protein
VAERDGVTAALVGTDLFAGLNPKVIARIAQTGHEMRFAPDEAVTVEGEAVGGLKPWGPRGVFFHLVLSGSGEVRQGGAVIGSVAPVGYFGELSLIDGEPRTAAVVAGSEGMTTFGLDKWAFGELLDEHPEVAVPMLRVLVARLRAAERH